MIQNFFPYDVIRKGQQELIDDIRVALKEKRILLAQAPTGLGKTVSALSEALSIAIKEKKKIFFLTNRHTQHHIAVSTLQDIKKKHNVDITCVDLIGKRWMCNQDIASLFGTDFNEYCKAVVEKGECEFYNNIKTKKGLTIKAQAFLAQPEFQSPLHNDQIIRLGKQERMCSYELSLALAKKAQVIIGDYYYLFNPFVRATLLKKLEIELEDVILIVDEGHNLPTRITDMTSSNLTSNMIKNALMEAKKFRYNGLIKWLQELMGVITSLHHKNPSQEQLVSKEEFISKVKQITDYDQLTDEIESAADEVRKKQHRSYLGGIASFLQAWKGEDQGFTRILSEKRGRQGPVLVLSYASLDPSVVTEEIFAKIDSGVVMSGTLNPTSMYKDLLGIERSMEKQYHSPFPPENKISMVIPKTTTKYAARTEQMFKQIAFECSQVASHVPGNIALFFPSYDFRDKVYGYLNTPKKFFLEKSTMTKEEKDTFVNEFKNEKDKGGILLAVTGANFAEGVDFPGDALSAVVVIGLPLARPDLKTKEIIKYYDQKFSKGWDYGYILPALSKCIQSAGRCIRTEKDRGIIVYLDERFSWSNYFRYLPREGLRVARNYVPLIENFFKS